MPWNQRSLQIYYRAVEWAAFSHELFSIVASVRFDVEFSDTCREQEREKEKERKRKNCRWFPANALLALKWCAWYGKVHCMTCEVKRTHYVYWEGDRPTNRDVTPAVAWYMAQPTSLPWKHAVQSEIPGVGHSLPGIGYPPPQHPSLFLERRKGKVFTPSTSLENAATKSGKCT